MNSLKVLVKQFQSFVLNKSKVLSQKSFWYIILNCQVEQFQKFHETLLTEKLDNFKSQKGELEELKEKIMKLEQINESLAHQLYMIQNK